MVGDTWWELHSQRSLRRMEDYIRMYFTSEKSVLNLILRDEVFLIDDIVPN